MQKNLLLSMIYKFITIYDIFTEKNYIVGKQFDVINTILIKYFENT